MATKPARLSSAAAAARWAASESLLFNDPASPFRAALSGRVGKLVAVTGENASGKSLFVRVAAAAFSQHGGLAITVSIRERTGAGLGEMNGMRRMMMFGDEHEQSTGATSFNVIRTALGNLDRDGGSLLIVDEPELGLSDGYARALGEYLGAGVHDLPKVCAGIIVVTHSRSLVRGLIDGYGRQPAHAAVAAETTPQPGLDRWLDAEERRTVADLQALSDAGLHRWRQTNKLLKD